jgi:hypothetical protein
MTEQDKPGGSAQTGAPKGQSAGSKDKSLVPDCPPAVSEDCLGRSMDQLTKAFSASARRWELIVYPSLFAFILLAAYGFYLIFNLTQDVARVAVSMERITTTMVAVSDDMNSVAANIRQMTLEVNSESAAMNEMVVHMRGMNGSMQSMTASMDQMRYHIAVMNNSVSRPMQFMNSFMPW